MLGSDASVAEILCFLALKQFSLGGGSAWLQTPFTPELKAGVLSLSWSSIFALVVSLHPLFLLQFCCTDVLDVQSSGNGNVLDPFPALAGFFPFTMLMAIFHQLRQDTCG